ncbi:MAG: hypothetical protein AAF490_14470 [Chloroflexota bacterium]
MNQPLPNQLPAKEFDCGTTTAPPDVATIMAAVLAEAKHHGLDIECLCCQSKETESPKEAASLMQNIHDAASFLFLQWRCAIQNRRRVEALAIARLFNGLTYDARYLNEKFQLIDWSHIEKLKVRIQTELDFAKFEPEKLGQMMNEAARAHTHERAWPWVVLPTFARQPYGRILLTTVDIGLDNPLIVTQPFFLPGQSTLFHTHGQNWAYSCPLGDCDEKNIHINTLWMPKNEAEPFPLNLIDNADYCSHEVAIVPPKLIHGIARKRNWQDAAPPISQLLTCAETQAHWLSENRFGELACMHIYCPDAHLTQHLKTSPFVQENELFFIEYDMIVFDHFGKSIWSGGGGSWPRRMIEYGTTGDHCGICFEEDERKENLNPNEVAKWFIQDPAPTLVKLNCREP